MSGGMLDLWEEPSGVSLSLLLPDGVLANQLSEEKNSEEQHLLIWWCEYFHLGHFKLPMACKIPEPV